MTRESAISRATRHFDEGAFIADLARRVAYLTESQVPESRPHLSKYLSEELGPAFERIDDPSLPTVLGYGHGDVIRGLTDQWRTGLSPWDLKQEGDRYYGRGSADNKAQHSINMAALATVIAERGKLGFNAKFLIETARKSAHRGCRNFVRVKKLVLKLTY